MRKTKIEINTEEFVEQMARQLVKSLSNEAQLDMSHKQLLKETQQFETLAATKKLAYYIFIQLQMKRDPSKRVLKLVRRYVKSAVELLPSINLLLLDGFGEAYQTGLQHTLKQEFACFKSFVSEVEIKSAA